MKLQRHTLQASMLIFTILIAPIIHAAEGLIVEETNDFMALKQEMQEKKLPLLLAFRADYCGYCTQLEREYLEPMVKSGDYADRILIRRFSMGKEGVVTDFNGEQMDADEFAYRHHATVTPTLVFLNSQGEEIAEQLVGYNSPDFYGAYLEKSIETAYQTVKNEK